MRAGYWEGWQRLQGAPVLLGPPAGPAGWAVGMQVRQIEIAVAWGLWLPQQGRSGSLPREDLRGMGQSLAALAPVLGP